MFDLVFKLAALSETVTLVIAKKGDIIHLSITSSGVGESKFKPLLVSGTEAQLLEELPNITNHLKAFQGVVNNIKSAADVATKEKEAASAKKAETKAKTDAKSTTKAPTKPASASLFDAAPTKDEPTKDDEDEDLDEKDEDSNDELVSDIPFVEAPAPEPAPVVKKETPKVEPTKPAEEEEIF